MGNNLGAWNRGAYRGELNTLFTQAPFLDKSPSPVLALENIPGQSSRGNISFVVDTLPNRNVRVVISKLQVIRLRYVYERNYKRKGIYFKVLLPITIRPSSSYAFAQWKRNCVGTSMVCDSLLGSLGMKWTKEGLVESKVTHWPGLFRPMISFCKRFSEISREDRCPPWRQMKQEPVRIRSNFLWRRSRGRNRSLWTWRLWKSRLWVRNRTHTS